MGKIKGMAHFHNKIKQFAPYTEPGHIAIIAHEDIDAAAADSLIAKKVKAVINIKCSVTGTFTNNGVYRLLNNKIKVFDMDDSTGIGPWINFRNIEIVDNHAFLRYSNQHLAIGSVKEYDVKLVRKLPLLFRFLEKNKTLKRIKGVKI
ncbi:hypothetical protein D7Z54_17500 [Salibacterium salarium]|uniref:Uncharacterized protein n=1 Tax=Salibacterium salarium TaxID=284579 RepID=A0A428N0Y3_9BACI|nr:hypothetical protein [Salibacterium salarium]RSL31998.1 hypothetical protein D7Z54_17500 [Salibacterium salarium]